MTGFKTPLHGRTHRAMGSDPIWPATEDAIRFNTSPQSGDWLDITTTATDGDGYGIHIDASDPILIEADNVTVDANNAAGQLLLHSEQNADLKAEKNIVIEGGINAGTTGNGVLVQATHGALDLQSSNGKVLVQAGGVNTVFLQGTTVSLGGDGGVANGVAVNVQLDAATSLTVLDSGGLQVFRIDESDGSVHIKTGTSVVANL